MLKGRLIAGSVLALSIGMLGDAFAQSTIPDLGEPFGPPVLFSQIADAVLGGDFAHANYLISVRAAQWLSNPDNLKTKAAQLVKDRLIPKLQAILNDSSKDEAQKRASVNALIDGTILDYQSPQMGDLGLSYKYSVESGFARLLFQVPTRVDLCYWQTGVGITGSPTLNGVTITGASASQYELWLIRYPTIRVNRIVDGATSEVARFVGSSVYVDSGSRVTINLSKWWESIPSIYNATRASSPAANIDSAIVDMPTSFFLKAGSNVSYHIVAEYVGLNSSRPVPAECKNNLYFQSSVAIDGDGDGIPDIIPGDAYAAAIAKGYGAPVSTIVDLLLLE